MCIGLVVLYTERLEACRDFYAGLGLTFQREQHGEGPEHYAAVLGEGVVFELYPASSARPATGSLRLGLVVSAEDAAAARPAQPTGRRLVTDPDGRTVEVLVR
ncbi:VOC family protein [Streptomyces lydicus]|uniref:VOC family protein n=1 Tax=Streptomyces lydicus TaxID=47763 RepID=UPI0036FB2F45